MNAKLALCILPAALVTACAGAPSWDTSVFPYQMSYGDSTQVPPVAEVPERVVPPAGVPVVSATAAVTQK